MSHHALSPSVLPPAAKQRRALRAFALTLLAIEFLDELVDGARQTAWPLIRLDLQLSYTQIGLLLAVPKLIGNLIEPPLFLLGDTTRRRALVLGGGVCFTLALLMVSVSHSFALLLCAFVLFSPASGAFVNLAQASLMDDAPGRREQNMARWGFAGSLGVVAGSAALNATVALGASWRVWFGAMVGLALLLTLAARRFTFAAPEATHEAQAQPSLKANCLLALRALRRGAVLRWLVLLELADLMLDGLHGFLALYFVDVAGVSATQAGLAIAVWSGIGLVGDLLLIPLLERVRGLTYLRWSAGVMVLLFPAFLLASRLPLKLALLGLVGLANSGWYPILKAQLYAALPSRSGTALALNNVMGLVAALLLFGLGLLAERIGLGHVMWLLLAGPLALVCALPRAAKSGAPC
jgi:FSR family fosmidomycin resistance protein-like MFS transporter